MEEVLAGSAKGNIFCLHGGEHNLRLEAGTPEDRTTKGQDDIASMAAGTMWVLWVFIAIEPGKISIRIAVHTRGGGWGHDELFVRSA